MSQPFQPFPFTFSACSLLISPPHPHFCHCDVLRPLLPVGNAQDTSNASMVKDVQLLLLLSEGIPTCSMCIIQYLALRGLQNLCRGKPWHELSDAIIQHPVLKIKDFQTPVSFSQCSHRHTNTHRDRQTEY